MAQIKNHSARKNVKAYILFIHVISWELLYCTNTLLYQKNHKMLQNKKVQTALLNKYD